jgi:hypothetical protein
MCVREKDLRIVREPPAPNTMALRRKSGILAVEAEVGRKGYVFYCPVAALMQLYCCNRTRMVMAECLERDRCGRQCKFT